MSKARLVITAVILQGLSQAEAARQYGLSPAWVSRLVARYRLEGQAAVRTAVAAAQDQPTGRVRAGRGGRVGRTRPAGRRRARRRPGDDQRLPGPHHGIRLQSQRGPDPDPPPPGRPHPGQEAQEHLPTVRSRPTQRMLAVRLHPRAPGRRHRRRGHHLAGRPLQDGLHVSAHRTITGPIVLATFRATITEYGCPASTLTDNGMVYTVRHASTRARGGRNAFETELAHLGVTQKNSRPHHPTTCGKVERFQQTLKTWLTRQPHPPATIDQLQALIDRFGTAQGLVDTERVRTVSPHRKDADHAQSVSQGVPRRCDRGGT
ncbi:MAG: integrase core domain-containing protein [Dermatophilaceae bacterium]